MAVVGGFLVYTSVQNIPLLDGLRSALRGEKPPAGPQTHSDTSAPTSSVASSAGLSPKGAALNDAINLEAQKYLGIKYRWGGTDPRTGLDCSGYVKYVLEKVGLQGVPRVTTAFLIWTGATTVKTGITGDLVCWPGHIGIVSRPGYMWNAPHTGTVVREDKIWSQPSPVYRRVNG